MANAVNLFVSEIVIDSDGGVYPSMVVLETFFREEKSDILMSDFSRGMEIFQKDLAHWSGDLHEIYSAFITKTLRAKFGDLLDHDNEASHIFADFLENIRSVSHRS